MPIRTQGELRGYLDEITELDMTPYKADEYLPNEHYHSFLKGCDCEIRIFSGVRGDDKENKSVQKYCKTHGVLCSKTGWELGWYLGTRSQYPAPPQNRLVPNETILAIREDFKTMSTKELMVKYKLSYINIYGIISGSRYKDIATSNLYQEYKKKRQ